MPSSILCAASLTVKATSDAAFQRLIGRIVSFYAEALFNPNWGERLASVPITCW